MSVSYADRAAHYGVEIGHASPPTLLDRYLRPGMSVAEAPSGSGHYLRDYARYGADIHLLDAEPAMLAAAHRQAHARSIPCRSTVFRIGAEQPDRAFELVVCPNAAVNYLIPQLGLHQTLVGLSALLVPGGALLLQVLLRHDDGTIDRGSCYDPHAPHQTWLAEWTRSDGSGGTLTRRRRQARTGNNIAVEFDRTHNGLDLGRSKVELTLTTHHSLATAAPGLPVVATYRGDGVLSELVLCKEK